MASHTQVLRCETALSIACLPCYLGGQWDELSHLYLLRELQRVTGDLFAHLSLATA